MLLGNCKVRHKGRVGDETVRIQISKVKLTTFLVGQTIGTGTVGGIGKDPTVGLYIEAHPIMTTDEIGLSRQTALPLSGNSCASTECDEQQGKDAAVTGMRFCTGIGDAFQDEVIGHEGIVHVFGNEIIKCLGLGKGIGETFCQLCTKGFDVRGKDNMGMLFVGVGSDCGFCTGMPINIIILSCVQIGVLNTEFVIIGHGFFPADSTLSGIFGRNHCIFGPNFFDLDIALLLTGGGDRQMCPQEHTGSEKLVL